MKVCIYKKGQQVNRMELDAFVDALTIDCLAYGIRGEIDKESSVELWNQLQDRKNSGFEAKVEGA
jgi:hypothetical protein